MSAPKGNPNQYQVVDVQAVQSGRPELGVKTFEMKNAPTDVNCDILIVGGGMGGVSAALATLRKSANDSTRVCLIEETDWLGGQMTAQGVSALDENYLVETSGANRTYQDMRDAIRSFYQTKRTLSAVGTEQEYLNPGNCWVTRLSFEPFVALDYLDAQLKPYIDAGRLSVFRRNKLVSMESNGENKSSYSATTVDLDSGEWTRFLYKMVIDATELGDATELAGLPYSTGSDSKAETGEEHAPVSGDRENVQDFVYPFVVEFRQGETHHIEKPKTYDQFVEKKKFSFDGYKMFSPTSIPSATGPAREVLPFWTYRRLVDRDCFTGKDYPFDIAMINWDSNDLRGENIIDKPAQTMADRLALAKDCSLGFLYWLQNDAPRDDGGKGYPELYLRRDLFGTADGLSKYPYIRESRRVKAKKTVVERDIVAATNPGARALSFDDTVGIGLYPVDIHGHQEVPGAGQETRPFQIPLSSLLTQTPSKLVPACKNIGVTHITNGAYRLHPIEWAIGEAAGVLAHFALKKSVSVEDIVENQKLLREYQNELIVDGCPLIWYEDVPTKHSDFAAIQFLTVSGIIPTDFATLRFRPDDSITRREAAISLAKVLGPRRMHPMNIADVSTEDPARTAVEICIGHGLFSLNDREQYEPARVLTKTEFENMSSKLKISPDRKPHEINDPLSRAEFASALYPLAMSKAPVIRR